MKLYRDRDVIYRTFEPIESDNEVETNYIKSPKDIFEYKARELQLYYYGSDDEGDAKDLKKNISTNFKKFQIMKSGSSDWFTNLNMNKNIDHCPLLIQHVC